MPTNPPAHDNRDQQLAKLHDRLAAAVDGIVTGNEWRQAVEFATRFRARSFNNAVLIWSQHQKAFERGSVEASTPTYVAGFRQWLTLGRQVSAGQKGYMIFAPVTARFASPAPAEQDSWRRLGRSEKPRPGEVVRPRMVGSRPAYVWDVSQTIGSPIPETPAPMLITGEAPAGLWAGLASLVDEARFTVLEAKDAASLGGANGVTNFESRTVSVRSDMDDAARAKTLIHEVAHIRMHEPSDASTRHRGISEVEAESVALMVGAAHGVDTSGYTIPYVSTWASTVRDKTVAEVVQATGERVRRAAVTILNQLPTEQIGDGDLLLFERSRTNRTFESAALAPDRTATGPEIRSL